MIKLYRVTKENVIKKAFDKKFAVSLDFNILSILYIFMEIKKIWLEGLNWILLKKNLCKEDILVIYKF